LDVIFKVANDLTGWYASIIAAKNEKKLLTSSSPLKLILQKQRSKKQSLFQLKIPLLERLVQNNGYFL
jgi:hypothetical protein